MRRNLKLGLIISTIFVLVIGAAVFVLINSDISQNKNADSVKFDSQSAIAAVIKNHSDFPEDTSSIKVKKIPTGGPEGAYAEVKYTTSVEKVSDTEYNIMLTKDWGISVNGKYIKSYWKYKVTPYETVLIESVDNDSIPNTIK